MDGSQSDNTPEAAPKTLRGVDVSSFQGPPGDWKNEAGSIVWASTKVTELGPGGSHYVNPDAAADWAYFAQAKLARIAYLFAHPSTGPADTVEFFASEMHNLGLNDTDGIMLDLEQTDGLGPGQVSSWAAEVMQRLRKRYNRMPILYTYLSFAEAGNTASLGRYPLWISDPSSPPGKPRVPPPWKDWTIHQYVASGIIDRDLAKFATVAAMEQAFGSEPKPQHGRLGGSIVSGITAVRWDDGVIVIAGVDGLNHVAIRRFEPGHGWGPWWNPSKVKISGPPGLVAWGASAGQLFYATESGVVELATEDTGRSWR